MQVESRPSSRLVLADTSVWIRSLRPGAAGAWLERFRALIIAGRIATLPIIKLELLAGAATEREYRELSDTLTALREMELTPRLWDEASAIAFRLRRKGITIPNVDALIAAAAILYGCRLLHDDRHFALIAKHESLRQERVK